MKKHIFREDYSSKGPALEVLEKLGYTYLSPEQIAPLKGGASTPLLTGILEKKLKELNTYDYKGKVYDFSQDIIDKAVKDLDLPIIEGLTKANEKIYDLLLLGKAYEVLTADGNKRSYTINYIDWENIERNDFHLTEEYRLEKNKKTLDESHIIPDLVLFVNGIPLAVIEAKRPSVPVDEAISQMIRNQKPDYIPDLFKFAQVLLATNKNEVSYATCGTPKKFWAVWKEEDQAWQEDLLAQLVVGREITRQDRDLVSFFAKERLFEIVQHFTLFDLNIKKIARYQQFFGVQAVLDRVEERDEAGNRRSGVVWHTQGSGKSLTMVMLAKYIFSKYRALSPKVIVVTDRVDLDDQIYETFLHTSLRPSKASSGKHLVELINDDGADIITTIVNKFVTASGIKEPVLSSDVFILVDESHRTQYGRFHHKMRELFPHACYLGFTGTPLMKDEKNTMMKFGSAEPIHTYTIADAVADKTILPLYYEGRMVDQSVNQRAIDTALDMITRNLKEEEKEEVMKKWSQFSKIASSDQRIRLVAFRIYEDYKKRLKHSKFNAMLATDSKIDAIRYWEYFKDLGDLVTAVVISPPDTREGHDRLEEESKKKENNFWKQMMDQYGSAEKYESYIKSEFIAGEIDILIVVDKLLTGFDAPKAQVFYIDKPLKEHNLLQAIARVNRLEEGKDRGLIIDFRGLLAELDTAMDMYAGSGLENFDGQDLRGALYDSLTVIGELRAHHSNLVDLFQSIKNKDDSEAYELLLADKKRRDLFYENLKNLSKSLDLAVTLEKVYAAIGDEISTYQKDYEFFYELRKVVSLRYGDRFDTKALEKDMQGLMDQYIAAEGVSRVTHLINLSDKKQFRQEVERLGTSAAKADAIRSRMGASISQHYSQDPSYYRKFSERIEKTLNEYKNKRISENEYLEQMYGHYEAYQEDDLVAYPYLIRENMDARAFYGSITDLVGEEEGIYQVERGLSEEDLAELSLKIEEAVADLIKVDWHNNQDINNEMAQRIEDLTYEFNVEKGLGLSWDEIDQLVHTIIKIAHERF